MIKLEHGFVWSIFFPTQAFFSTFCTVLHLTPKASGVKRVEPLALLKEQFWHPCFKYGVFRKTSRLPESLLEFIKGFTLHLQIQKIEKNKSYDHRCFSLLVSVPVECSQQHSKARVHKTPSSPTSSHFSPPKRHPGTDIFLILRHCTFSKILFSGVRGVRVLLF